MDGGQTADACGVEALHAANPQLKIGVDGVLVEYRYVDSMQGACQLLHGKGIGAGASAYPQHVDTRIERQLHMVGRSYFRAGEHAGFFLHALHPGEGCLALAFKAAGLGAWFPNPGTEDVDAGCTQLTGGGEDLFFGLGAARARYK